MKNITSDELLKKGFIGEEAFTEELVVSSKVKGHGNWLDLSARFWFTVTVVGQWLFIIYITGYYGTRFIENGINGFDGTHLANGFIIGDSIGNIALAVHVLIAGMIIAAGQIQLVPNIRQKVPKLHRASGWFYMFASVIVSIAGIYLVWFRDRMIGSFIQDIGVTGGGLLTLFFAAIALFYAIKKDFVKHRQWALRLFMVVSAVWFLRLMVFAWLVLTGGVGIDMETFSGPFLNVVHFAQYLLPLAVLELYFWAQNKKSEFWHKFTSGVIATMCLFMIIGISSTSIFFWIPHIGT